MEYSMRATVRLAAMRLCLVSLGAGFASAQGAPPPQQQNVPPRQPYSPPPPPQSSQPPQQRHSRDTFRPEESVREGLMFFCTVSRGLAQGVEKAVSRWGEPNGYI